MIMFARRTTCGDEQDYSKDLMRKGNYLNLCESNGSMIAAQHDR